MRLILLSLAALAAAACGGDDDAVIFPDAAPRFDAAPRGDGGVGGCADPTVVLPTDWQSAATVSTGLVASQPGAGMVLTDVDATAGGAMSFGGKPYTYLKFDLGAMTATRVDITDVESYASMAWDLGFKRTVIRANGGDSGPAGVRVSSVAGASLAAVTAVPDPSTFTEDDWADLSCTLVAGLLGEPFTAMGSWYDYNQTTHLVAPMAVVYIVQLPDGQQVKLRIAGYYGDPANPMRGANYDLEWAHLP